MDKMLRASVSSSYLVTLALLALVATPIQAQDTASTTTSAAMSTASTSATPSSSTASSASAIVAPYMASCPTELELQITSCLDIVARDGAVLPCNADDWWCNCNNWQGIISCYQPCPNLQDQLDINWNQQNCQGQHGFANQFGGNSSGTYVGSKLSTTGSNGATRSIYSDMPVVTLDATASAWAWSSTASVSSQQRLSSSASRHFAIPAGILASSLVLVAASDFLIL